MSVVERARTVQERAAELAARVAEREGCELVQCEYVHQSGSWYLRIFVDRQGGVTLDDCVTISRQVSAALDVEDFIPHSYNLEVSSPGIDRPLLAARDYERFSGAMVRIRTSAPVRGRRRFRGVLDGLEDGKVKIHEPGGQAYDIPLARVHSARLDPEME